MQNSERLTRQQIGEFLKGSEEISFTAQSKEEVYGWVQRVLVRREVDVVLGHVGLPAHWWEIPYNCKFFNLPCNPRTGLNDLVMDEVGGTAMTIGFQWLDKRFQRPMESRIHSRALIDTMRIFTNPPQSMANLFRFKKPWYRDNRDSQRP